MKRRTSVALAVLIVLITAGCAVSGSENDKTKASASQTGQQVFIGVFREGAPRNMGYIKQFVDQTGKKPAMVMWYQDWAQKFPAEAAQNVVDFGAVPHIVWEPWYWGNRDKVKLDDIIAGKWDDYIKSWAKEIIAFKSPVFLRVGHEFNIDGYPWGIVHNEKDPEKYVKAYRHIVDVFRKEKVNNAKWIWCFMNYSFPDEPWNDWTKAYPGNDYVDWIGIDGYNWGKTQSWSDWQAFKYLFRDQVRQCRELWPDKPIMVAEFASAEKGGDKAAWIRELPGYLKSSMRDIDAIIWFDLKKEADWRITSSDKSLAAFKEIMKDPIFSSSGQAMAALSLTGKKAEKRLAEALRNYGTITVDGDLKEWGKCRPISMADRSFVKEGSDWGGPEDLSGLAYVMWDDEYLYFAADITDKIPLVNKQQKQD
ncbi:MAG: hypothetical protein JW782_00435, partial [Candidatus Saganbacteria bacterium]|nr:hypothetical protein [Candidatus Saganbacteria bacterium]